MRGIARGVAARCHFRRRIISEIERRVAETPRRAASAILFEMCMHQACIKWAKKYQLIRAESAGNEPFCRLANGRIVVYHHVAAGHRQYQASNLI